MRDSHLNDREGRTYKPAMVVFIVGLMLLAPLISIANNAPRSTNRPDLGIEQMSINVTMPEDGDPINVGIDIKNFGDAFADGAVLNVYEDQMSEDHLIGAPTMVVPLPAGGTSHIGYNYDTTGKRGTRIFYAVLTDITPNEANGTWMNNNASLEVNIFRDEPGFDTIYDGSETSIITGERQYDGFHALFGSSKVTIQKDTNGDCDVIINQDQPFQYGLMVSDNARLDIRSCRLYSNYEFYITVSDNGMLTIENSNLTNATIRSGTTNVSSSVTIKDSQINSGGLMIGTPWTTIMNSHVEGDFVFSGGNITIDDSEFYIDRDSPASISNSNIVANEISFFADKSDVLTIMASGNSDVVLKKVWDIGKNGKSTISFDALDKAIIRIYRELEVHAQDTTDMPIEDSTLDVYYESMDLAGNLEDSNITDAVGNSTFVLLSDILVDGNDGFRGNYEIKGTFNDDRSVTHIASVTHRLSNIDELAFNDSHDKLTLTFEPIPPKVCENPYKPSGTLTEGVSLGGSGCIQVTSTVKYINSTIKILQDEDFQSAIYIEGNGQLILENSNIWSDHRMNIYVLGNKAFLKSTETLEMSSIVANAIVGVDGSMEMKSVNITANIRGRYNSFIVGQGSTITGTWLVSDANSMNVFDTDIYSPDLDGVSIINGNSLSIGGGDFFVNHFILNSTSLSAIQDSNMWGNAMSSWGDTNAMQWYTPGSSLTLISDGKCQVIGSQVNYDEFSMDCSAFVAETSSFNRDIIYGEDATSGHLKSVDAPAVKVLGDATVKTYFIVSLTVTNALGGPINEAPITITRMGGGSEEAPKPTETTSDGKASFDLLAEKITSGNIHEWLGNYKVVIQGCSQSPAYEFSVGGGEGDQSYIINFPDCVPDIEGLFFSGLELNRTNISPPDTSVMLTGEVKVTYEGGISLSPDGPVEINVVLPSKELVTADANEDGSFAIVFDLTNKGLLNESQSITINATYKDPDNPSNSFKISDKLDAKVLPENPKRIKSPFRFPVSFQSELTDKKVYKYGEDIVVQGKAVYDTDTPVPEGSTVTVQILSTTVQASSTTGGDGTFTVIFKNTVKVKKEEIKFVKIKVTAKHPYYGNTLTGSHQDQITFKPKVESGPDNTWFWIVIVIVIIVIVAVFVGMLLFFRFKIHGTLVECGECGAFIPENANKCTKCGTEFETEVVKCSECEAWIPALAVECPKCGVEFKKVEQEAEAVTEEVGPPGQVGPPGVSQPPPTHPVAKIKK